MRDRIVWWWGCAAVVGVGFVGGRARPAEAGLRLGLRLRRPVAGMALRIAAAAVCLCGWGRLALTQDLTPKTTKGWRGVAPLAFAWLGLWPMVVAADNTYPEIEYQDAIKVKSGVSPLGANPFGEDVNLYTGELSFSQTDVSLPGTGLPIVLSRTFAVGKKLIYTSRVGAFADWDLDLPRISTLVAASSNSTIAWNPATRCSTMSFPNPVSVGGQEMAWTSWWNGYQLVVPGAGSQELLGPPATRPPTPVMNDTNGAAISFPPNVTTGNWMIGCLPATANGQPGEGFFAVSPDGTRYWLNQLVYAPADSMAVPNLDYPSTGYPYWFLAE